MNQTEILSMTPKTSAPKQTARAAAYDRGVAQLSLTSAGYLERQALAHYYDRVDQHFQDASVRQHGYELANERILENIGRNTLSLFSSGAGSLVCELRRNFDIMQGMYCNFHRILHPGKEK